MKVAQLTDTETGRVVAVAVVLTPKDRENIANMAPEATVYACFEEGVSKERISGWLDFLKNEDNAPPATEVN